MCSGCCNKDTLSFFVFNPFYPQVEEEGEVPEEEVVVEEEEEAGAVVEEVAEEVTVVVIGEAEDKELMFYLIFADVNFF